VLPSALASADGIVGLLIVNARREAAARAHAELDFAQPVGANKLRDTRERCVKALQASCHGG
jgi:anti-sigma-K factor RskA